MYLRTTQRRNKDGSIVRQMHHLLSPGGRVVICHCEGRTTVNSHYQANAAALSMPLPAARTLAASLERYFDVDILIDSPQLYVVSGIRRPL